MEVLAEYTTKSVNKSGCVFSAPYTLSRIPALYIVEKN